MKSSEHTLAIAFIIPACNEERLLADCLKSIKQQVFERRSNLHIESIVVDCESSDNTRLIALRFQTTVISAARANAGSTRNKGTNRLESDFYAFVDADCVLPPNWLETCLSHFEDSMVVAVGASQALANPGAPWIERTWTDMISPVYANPWDSVEWLPAFNLIVRSKAFHDVNGFNESLITCEDSDLTFRLSKIGKLRLDHRIKVQHQGESKTVREFIQREMWRSRGNLRSAIERHSLKEELKSLAVPPLYFSALCFLFFSPLIHIVAPLFAQITGAIGLIISAGAPITFAMRRGTHTNIWSRSLVATIYLVARCLGLIWRVERVTR